MEKLESHYFQHDFNARHDPKMEMLLMRHGVAGIGIFWCLVESIYEQGGRLEMSACPSIAFSLHVDPSLIESVVKDFELFSNNGEIFWSESVDRRMSKIEDIRNKRKEAIAKRWKKEKEKSAPDEAEKYNCNTNVEQVNNTSNTSVVQELYNKNKRKEIKEKEIKDNSILLSTANAVDSLHSAECDTAVNYPGIVKYWNDNVSNFHSAMGTIQDINEGTKRRDNVRARIKQYGKQVFADTLIKALQSDFLNGRTGRGKVFNFDWVILPSNFVKVRDGNYDNDKTVIPVSNGNTNNQEHSTRESRESDAAAIVDRLLREDN